jgi:uncharacterized protein YbaP (TraB family)
MHRLASVFALATATLFATACNEQTVSAPEPVEQQAAAETRPVPAPVPRDPGLPMWVIRDDDSTIYLTGTIHMLPPDLVWRSDKLETALAESDTLWLELAEIADMEAFREKSGPLIQEVAVSTGPPLSQLLNERERVALNTALSRAGVTGEAARRMDNMKPWFVMQAIATAPLLRAGYIPDAGIDIKLAAMAKELGKPVKGLEQVEDQVRVLSSGSEEGQLRRLRMLLAQPAYAMDMSGWLSSATFEAWTEGNALPVTLMITIASMAGNDDNGMSMDALLGDRNENWAIQIEEMLARDGVDFIAVGAAHLVGPDSVQMKLKQRGIEAARY